MKTFSEKIEKIVNETVEAHLKEYTLEMQILTEKKKFTLWIASLSTAVQAFLTSKYSFSDLSIFFQVLFFIAGTLFFLNLIVTLYNYRIFVDLFASQVEKVRRMNKQRLFLFVMIEKGNGKIFDEIKTDFESDKLAYYILDFKYWAQTETQESVKKLQDLIDKLGKKVLDQSVGGVTTYLFVQTIVTFFLVIFC